jgi:aspartyl/asparaginyl beta-hydroxylase (cupin superfamily)
MIPLHDQCWIKVDGIKCHWQAGRNQLFDHTYRHKVGNDGDEDRVVLLLHIRRPLHFPTSLLGSLAALRCS